MLNIIIDTALIGTSACALLYCARLHGQIAKLHKLDRGAGKAVADLSSAIRQSQAASAGIAEAAREGVAALNAAYADLGTKRQETEDLIGILDGQASAAQAKIRQTQTTAERAVAVATRHARVELEALGEAVTIARKVSEIGKASSDRSAGEVASGEGRIVQRGVDAPNPFLRAVAS